MRSRCSGAQWVWQSHDQRFVLLPARCTIAFMVCTGIAATVSFRQVRPGYRGPPSRASSFRTMQDASDPAGSLLSDGSTHTSCRCAAPNRAGRIASALERAAWRNGHRGAAPLLMIYLDCYTREEVCNYVSMVAGASTLSEAPTMDVLVRGPLLDRARPVHHGACRQRPPRG